jgi:hypothetical protein
MGRVRIAAEPEIEIRIGSGTGWQITGQRNVTGITGVGHPRCGHSEGKAAASAQAASIDVNSDADFK